MQNERTHIDLFSGLGGFALAARANGVRTIQFCECDPRCQAFLSKAWPGVPVHGDVRSLAQPERPKRGQETKGRNEHDRTDTGREEASSGTPQCFADVWLITGGVPCQPASRAGKQRGKEDDRWLWPDAIRVIAAVKPTWALLENPPGIGDVGLNGILSALEAQGYEVRVLSIPACAVNAPHRRERYWIVCRLGNAEAVAGIGRSRPIHQGPAKERRGGAPYTTGLWNSCVWLPCADGKVRRAPNSAVELVDGVPVDIFEILAKEGWPHRSILGALGNSIVWQVASEIIKAMVACEDMEYAPVDNIG